MTDVSHFYGDDCDPPHEEPSDGTKFVLGIGGREEEPVIVYEGERDATIAMTEPEPLLDRLRRLDREATPGPWIAGCNDNNEATVGSLTVPEMHGEGCLAVFGQKGEMDAELTALLRSALPEIIEAFELRAEVGALLVEADSITSLVGYRYTAGLDLETITDLRSASSRLRAASEAAAALLSKVSGNG